MGSGKRLRLELRPQPDGCVTQLWLYGWAPTALPPRQLRRLLSTLACWSGSPVHVVLFVGSRATEWCGQWGDALATVPGHHLELELLLEPDDVSPDEADR